VANRYTDAVHKAILPGKGRNRVTLKAVLTAMAWHTDNKTGAFWGSHSKFAREANCSRQAAKENIPTLIELGLVTVIGERPTRFGPCHVYKMNLQAVLKLADQGVELPGDESSDSEETPNLDDIDPKDLDSDQPKDSVGSAYGDPTHALGAGESRVDQGVELPPPGSSAPPYPVAKRSDQVAQRPENSSLNSSFLNSSINSSSKPESKTKEHDDKTDSQAGEVSQSPKQQQPLPANPEVAVASAPVNPTPRGVAPNPTEASRLETPGTESPVYSASPRPRSAAPRKPVCKRLNCGGPFSPKGVCKKCGAEPSTAVAPPAPKVWKDQHGLVVPGLPHKFGSHDREAQCQHTGCETTWFAAHYDDADKYCDYATEGKGAQAR